MNEKSISVIKKQVNHIMELYTREKKQLLDELFLEAQCSRHAALGTDRFYEIAKLLHLQVHEDSYLDDSDDNISLQSALNITKEDIKALRREIGDMPSSDDDDDYEDEEEEDDDDYEEDAVEDDDDYEEEEEDYENDEDEEEEYSTIPDMIEKTG